MCHATLWLAVGQLCKLWQLFSNDTSSSGASPLLGRGRRIILIMCGSILKHILEAGLPCRQELETLPPWPRFVLKLLDGPAAQDLRTSKAGELRMRDAWQSSLAAPRLRASEANGAEEGKIRSAYQVSILSTLRGTVGRMEVRKKE